MALLWTFVACGDGVPVPTITHIPAAASDPVQHFSVTFSEPVSGLRASDFAIDAGRANVAHAEVVGYGTAFTLSVTLAAGDMKGCPSGYVEGAAGLGWCGRVVAPAARADANAACAPYVLASMLTAEHLSAAGKTASVRMSQDYWYVRGLHDARGTHQHTLAPRAAADERLAAARAARVQDWTQGRRRVRVGI